MRNSRRYPDRDGAFARNWRESIKRFHGNAELSAALLPLAQKLLGDVIRRTEQGRIAAGARIVQLADGSIIKVTRNGAINTIDILTVPPPSGGVRGVISRILVHPATKSAPHGWIVNNPPDGSRTTHPSPYPLAFAYRVANTDPPVPPATTAPAWVALRPPATTALLSYQYGAGVPVRATGLARDQPLATGNQFAVSADGFDLWSWWHSPRGDSRMTGYGPSQMPTDNFYTPFYGYDSSDPFKKTFLYLASNKNFYTMPFLIIKNGGELVMEATDEIKENYVWIAGVHVLGPTKVLAVLLEKLWKKFDLFTFEFIPGEDPVIVKHGTIADLGVDYGEQSFPVRFKPDGTEAAFLCAEYIFSGGTMDTIHHLVRCAIVRSVDPDTLAESFSGSIIGNTSYHPTLYSRSGSADGYTLEQQTEIRAGQNDFLYPIAMDYNFDGTLELIWLKGGGSGSGYETVSGGVSGTTITRHFTRNGNSSSWLNVFFPDGGEQIISSHTMSASRTENSEESWSESENSQYRYDGGFANSSSSDTITGTSILDEDANDFSIIYASTRKRLLVGATVFKIGIGDHSNVVTSNNQTVISGIQPPNSMGTVTGSNVFSQRVIYSQEIKLFQSVNVTKKTVFSVSETPGYTEIIDDTHGNKPPNFTPNPPPYLQRFIIRDVGLNYNFYQEKGSICGVVDFRNNEIPVYLTEVVWPKGVYYVITSPAGATPRETPAGLAIMTNIGGADGFLRYGTGESYNRPVGIV